MTLDEMAFLKENHQYILAFLTRNMTFLEECEKLKGMLWFHFTLCFLHAVVNYTPIVKSKLIFNK